MIIQACLNGARPVGYHPRLPADPDAIAADAAAVVRAGANELHIHIRRPDGTETLAPDIVGPTLRAVRRRAPGTAVGISTGAWIERDADRTLTCIGRWTERPDYASVNLSEPGAPAVIERLLRLGIGVEAGLSSVADARRYLALGFDALSLRVLMEINEQDPIAAETVTDGILGVLAAAPVTKPILLHGFDATVWPFVRRAFREGFSTRVGLEDGTSLPDGSSAATNADIVAAAVELWRAGRAPAD
jgi:uncharacterized protein (DUF849 family)